MTTLIEEIVQSPCIKNKKNKKINFIKLDISKRPCEDPNKTYCNVCCIRVSAKCSKNKYYKCLNGHIYHIKNNKQILY